ncbi:MAG: hypothetical protein ABJH08_11330 [Balneola sp.]
MKYALFIISALTLFSIQFTSAQERNYKEIGLELVEKIKLSDHEIFRPNLLSSNKKGDVVFFDYVKFQIVHYNNEESVVKFMGEGKGRGPEEFQMVMDLKINNNGVISIADREKGKIIRWSKSGNFIEEYKTKEKFMRPSRIAACENEKEIYILSSQYSPKGIFHYIDIENEVNNTSFFKIKDVDKRLPYYTDGELDCDEEGNLYFASRYVNSIKKYDKTGNLIFDIPVYGFEPNEKIMEKKGRLFSPAKDVRRASGDIYMFGINLLVGFSNHKYSDLKLIDVYNPVNGKYRFSIDVPFKFQEFSLSDNNIFFISEESDNEIYLLVYRYDKSFLNKS